MDRETIFAIFILILTVVGVYLLFNNYVKLLSKMSIRSHKKRINKGKVTDEKVIKMYNRFNRNSKTPYGAYSIYGKAMSRMQEDIYKLYHDEMMKRNLL